MGTRSTTAALAGGMLLMTLLAGCSSSSGTAIHASSPDPAPSSSAPVRSAPSSSSALPRELYSYANPVLLVSTAGSTADARITAQPAERITVTDVDGWSLKAAGSARTYRLAPGARIFLDSITAGLPRPANDLGAVEMNWPEFVAFQAAHPKNREFFVVVGDTGAVRLLYQSYHP